MLPKFLLIFVLYTCHFFNIVLMPFFPSYLSPLQLLTLSPVHRHAFPLLCLAYFIGQ